MDRLVIRFGVNSADALRAGDVDLVGGGGRDQAAALEFVERPAPGIAVRHGPDSAWEHLDFNLRSGHPALRSKLVRRALAYGIDREAIVRDLFPRTVRESRALQSTAFLPSERGYRPNWAGYRYRPAEARRLLEQAGCRSAADGVYVCGDRRLSLEFVTTAGVPQRERALQLIQRQLAAVGVRVEPVYAASFAFLEAGDFDAALFTWPKDSPGETGSWPYSCAQRERLTGYCSRLFNEDFDQLARIVDPGRYIAVANRADRRLARDVPVLPLFQPLRVYAHRSSLRGVRANPFGAVTWNAEDWWLAEPR